MEYCKIFVNLFLNGIVKLCMLSLFGIKGIDFNWEENCMEMYFY